MKDEKFLLPQNFTYHTHTSRCKHAFGQDEQYIIHAIKAGYKTIGFADHGPIKKGYSTRKRMEYEELDEYITSLKKLKEKYKDQIEVLIGIEAEPYPENEEIVNEMFEKLDYVILSIHGNSCENQFVYAHDKNDKDIIEYADLAVEAMSKKKWLYLAHPDYFLRKETDFNQACKEATHKLCQAAEKYDIIFEVNLTGIYHDKIHFKQGDYYFYPHRLFWEIVSQYNIKCIYGLDCHNPEVFDHLEYYQKAQKELEGLNLNFINKPLL